MEDDQRVEEWAKLIEATSGLVSGLAWPVAVVLAVWLIMRRHNAAFSRLIDRITSLQFPGGQIDLAAAAAARREEVDELAEQVANQDAAEDRRVVVRELAASAVELGAIEQSRRIADILGSLSSETQSSAVEAALAELAVRGHHPQLSVRVRGTRV